MEQESSHSETGTTQFLTPKNCCQQTVLSSCGCRRTIMETDGQFFLASGGSKTWSWSSQSQDSTVGMGKLNWNTLRHQALICLTLWNLVRLVCVSPSAQFIPRLIALICGSRLYVNLIPFVLHSPFTFIVLISILIKYTHSAKHNSTDVQETVELPYQ